MVTVPQNLVPSDDRIHRICINCMYDGVQYVRDGEIFVYKCPKCNAVNPRAIVFDPMVKWWIDTDTNQYWHESVAVIVVNFYGQILLFDRTIYPYAKTIPSGHLNPSENPIDGAIRELTEETGLIRDHDDLLFLGLEYMTHDSCSRGADHHLWNLYAIITNQFDRIDLNEEGKNASWYNFRDIDHNCVIPPVSLLLKKHKMTLEKLAASAMASNGNINK